MCVLFKLHQRQILLWTYLCYFKAGHCMSQEIEVGVPRSLVWELVVGALADLSF